MTTCSSHQYLHNKLSRRDDASVRKACVFAEQNLTDIVRRSGETYAQHGFEVASALKESSDDIHLLRIAILHDVLVHPKGEYLLLESPLDEEERNLVHRMHSLRRLHIDENTQDLDRVVESFLEDSRLLPLRMAHRINDIRHLHRFERSLARQIAHETLHMYAAIAGRLGMYVWRYEMEDISFRLLNPQAAKNLEMRFAQAQKLDHICLEQTANFIAATLKKEGINGTVEKRIKALYSTYRKMIIKKRTFDELTDRLALRIIVNEPMDCYRALAIIHDITHPVPGKLKDYIGAPKENGYQSIHTVIYPIPGVTEQPMEIQIRTTHMNQSCEYGGASHGEYKNAHYALKAKPARVNLFRNLQSLHAEARSPKQFEQTLRKYFDENHIAIFDAENNLYHIKQPATVLDFACHAHPRRYHMLKSVKINGRRQPLDTRLHDGDTIEVLFGRRIQAKEEWLRACAHNITKKHLGRILKKPSNQKAVK